MSKFKGIIIGNRGNLRIIKFNNPKKRNAINKTTYFEVIEALKDAGQDETVKIVAITGAGDFYSAGNDISDSSSLDAGGDVEEALKKAQAMIIEFTKAFYQFPKLIVCVVNGPCIGIAATTAALCDVIYCSDKAYFQTPFTKLGLCPEGCSSYTFPRILGNSKAAEMLLLNYKMTAEEALKCNFVSAIYKEGELETKIWPQLQEYAKLPQDSVKTGKMLMRKWNKDILDKVVITEAEALHGRWNSEEFFVALSTFMSGRNKKSKM